MKSFTTLKKNYFIVFFFVFTFIFINNSKATTLWSQDFTAVPSNFGGSSGTWTRNSGTTYACSAGDYAYYSGGAAYFATSTFHVGRGKGVAISFTVKRSSGSGTLQVFARVGGFATFNTSSRQYSS